MPQTHDDSPEFIALRWIIEKMMYAERLNALDVQSTRVEFPGHAPMVNFGSMVTSDSALIQLIRDAARQTNSSSVFVIRPTTVAPDRKRGVFCYVEALFGKIHHTYYQMYDGEG